MKKQVFQGKYMPFIKENIDAADEADKKKFRLSSRNLFLTYSQTCLTKEEVIEQLKMILADKIQEYIVAQEKHEDGGLHIHVYLKLYSKINILNPNKLDLTDSSGAKIHGQYESARNIENVKNYVKKSVNYITNIFNSEIFNKNLYLIAKEQGLEEAMKYFCEQKPEWVSIRYKNVRSNLQSFLSNQVKKTSTKFTIENFNYPEDITNWFKNEKHAKTLVLIGKSGFGKTQAMKTLLIDYNPLLIKEINGLKDLKFENKALILDDVDWKEVSRETKLSIFDKDESGQVRVLYDCVTVPSDIIKVVISNFDKNIDDILNVPELNYIERREASESISRRIKKIKLKDSLIVQNTFVTNNLIINN